MKRKERRPREASVQQVLDDLEAKYYEQVAASVDFARLDAIEQTLVLELAQLVADGKLPAPLDRSAIQARAATLIAWLLCTLSDDPRRTKQTDDDCELCRAFGSGPLHS